MEPTQPEPFEQIRHLLQAFRAAAEQRVRDEAAANARHQQQQKDADLARKRKLQAAPGDKAKREAQANEQFQSQQHALGAALDEARKAIETQWQAEAANVKQPFEDERAVVEAPLKEARARLENIERAKEYAEALRIRNEIAAARKRLEQEQATGGAVGATTARDRRRSRQKSPVEAAKQVYQEQI